MTRTGRVAATLILMALVASPVRATQIHVPGDFGTLLEAADAAVSGDSVLVAPGTYTDRETRSIGGASIRASAFVPAGVTILGTGGADITLLVADAPEAGALNAVIVSVPPSVGAGLEIEGLTLRGGSSGVVGVSTEGAPVNLGIRDCVVEQCGDGIVSEARDVRVWRTTFRNNQPNHGVLFIVSGDDVVVQDSVFEDNEGITVRVSDTDLLTMARCRFARNSGDVVLQASSTTPVQVLDSRFEDNVAETSHACIDLINCDWILRGTLLARNRSGHSIVSASSRSDLEISSNTFYGNECEDPVILLGGSTRDSYDRWIASNVIARNSSSSLYSGPRYDRISSCNLFWDNSGSVPLDNGTDLHLDPQFCDPVAGDFSVTASSPCLAANNFGACGPLGAYGEGCASGGLVVHRIGSDPDGRNVVIDGVTASTPELVVWPAGSSHTIECPEVQPAGSERYLFESWSDGGAASHEVAASDTAAEFVATMSREFDISIVVEGSGATLPEEGGWYPEGTELTIEAIPAPGHRFVEWAGEGAGVYRGTDNPALAFVDSPFTQVARFELDAFDLTTAITGGLGRIVPEEGPFEAFSSIVLRARPERGYHFVEWKGEGDGSYTGRSNPALITFNEPLTQVAEFAPVRFDVSLSLSATNSRIRTGPPIGFGEVHVWVTCAGGRRVQELELNVSGDMDVLAFVPAPGMVAVGTDPVRVSTGTCQWASVRLGHFLVLDPDGGSLCVDAVGGGAPLTVTDCSGGLVPWPERVSFTGVNTAGGAPCSTGTGCINQIEMGPEAGEGTDVALAAPMRIGLNEVFPNPFTGETTIRYAVSRPQSATLTVYDVTGRRVRALWHGPAAPGPASVVWDGRDGRGRVVSAGVYFVRILSDEVVQARKVVRIGTVR